jgi:hypothetical protein
VPYEEAGRQHRRHRSRAEADQVAADYEASGLSREAFGKQRDVPLKTLDRYVTRYRKQKAAGGGPQRWVAVEVAGNGGELSVLLSSGRRIEVKRGFDAGTLRQLVAVLEQA